MARRSTSPARAWLRPGPSSRRCGSRRGSPSIARKRPRGNSMQASSAPSAKAEVSSLTDYVAGFVTGTKASDIPKDVAHLGKRSVLDGVGLALAGAASHQSEISRRYLEGLGI